jgi:hypothetical protein
MTGLDCIAPTQKPFTKMKEPPGSNGIISKSLRMVKDGVHGYESQASIVFVRPLGRMHLMENEGRLDEDDWAMKRGDNRNNNVPEWRADLQLPELIIAKELRMRASPEEQGIDSPLISAERWPRPGCYVDATGDKEGIRLAREFLEDAASCKVDIGIDDRTGVCSAARAEDSPDARAVPIRKNTRSAPVHDTFDVRENSRNTPYFTIKVDGSDRESAFLKRGDCFPQNGEAPIRGLSRYDRRDGGDDEGSAIRPSIKRHHSASPQSQADIIAAPNAER